MATKTKLPEAHPAHLPDGSWGLKSEADLPAGTRVQCVSKAGKRWEATLGEQVSSDGWGYLYARADQRKPRASAAQTAAVADSDSDSDDESPY